MVHADTIKSVTEFGNRTTGGHTLKQHQKDTLTLGPNNVDDLVARGKYDTT